MLWACRKTEHSTQHGGARQTPNWFNVWLDNLFNSIFKWFAGTDTHTHLSLLSISLLLLRWLRVRQRTFCLFLALLT